jgi:ABC-type transport system involved in multi-copper enzyme maturation permease subunit
MAWLLIASLLLSFTSYLLLTNKELSLLDQTEMLWLLSKLILASALLIVAIDASSTITAEFERETAETLFLAPVSLSAFVCGKFLGSFTLWLAIWIVSLPYVVAASAGTHLAPAFSGYTLLLGSLGVAGFIFFIFAISLLYRSSRSTLTTSLIVLFALAAPALFSSTLKTATFAAVASKVNPMDSMFSAMDNVLVDYHTSLLSNWRFILPLIGFCLFTGAMLVVSMRVFKRRGIIKNG